MGLNIGYEGDKVSVNGVLQEIEDFNIEDFYNHMELVSISYKEGVLELYVNFRYINNCEHKELLAAIKEANKGFEVKIEAQDPLLYFPQESKNSHTYNGCGGNDGSYHCHGHARF